MNFYEILQIYILHPEDIGEILLWNMDTVTKKKLLWYKQIIILIKPNYLGQASRNAGLANIWQQIKDHVINCELFSRIRSIGLCHDATDLPAILQLYHEIIAGLSQPAKETFGDDRRNCCETLNQMAIKLTSRNVSLLFVNNRYYLFRQSQ